MTFNSSEPLIHYAVINGVKLAYQEFGTGTPILCLHGGMGIDSTYLDTPGIRGLASKNRRVISFDQRGHGRSDRSDDAHYTHRQWTEDARQLAEHLELGRFVLLGHSYGGFLALEFALRWPEMLSHLVLICTSAGPVNLRPPSCNTDAELRELYKVHWPGFFAAHEKHWVIFERLTFSVGPYRAAFERALPNFNVRSQVQDITIPTLLISGTEDRYRPDLAWLHRAVPNSSLALIDAAGHMPFIERPAVFAAVIANFLSLSST